MFETITGCAVLAVCNLSLFYAAHLLVRRFYAAAPPAVRLAASGTVFCALLILVLQALSPLHAITRGGSTLACLVIALLSHLFLGRRRNVGAELEAVTAWLRDGLSSRWSALIIACGFVVLLSLSRALLMPPMSWDSLTYHLTFAAYWVQKGSLLKFIAPDQIIENACLPINGELFAAWLMLPFHSDLLVNLMNFPLTLLGGIACYAMARELGLARNEAAFAPALLCFAPVIYAQITTAYVDNAVFAFCAAAVLFALRYLRNGQSGDALLALSAAGILIGIKYTCIPVTGLILLAVAATRPAPSCTVARRCGMLCAGLLILFALGGRQYCINALDARNPLYPVPVKLFGRVIAEGSKQLEQVDAWAAGYEARRGMDRLSFWEREQIKLRYLPRSAGPKFLFFLMAASLAPLVRPRHVPGRQWYFLAAAWAVPIVLFYTGTSADYIRKAFWIEGSTRFLSPFIALFTIQALLLIKRFIRNFDYVAFLFAALVIWDLLHVNTAHEWEIEVLYPLLLPLGGLPVVLLGLMRASGTRPARIPPWLPGAALLLVLATGCCLLQDFRDSTRYAYYRRHYDYFNVPKIFELVNGWEFLDRPGEKKKVGLSVGWDPPGHIWFFYPLMGSRLQNEVMYVSPRYRHEVPAWLHQNMLRGDDRRLWLANLRQNKADYIFVAEPWPNELNWMEGDRKTFRLVFYEQRCRIFHYEGHNAPQHF